MQHPAPFDHGHGIFNNLLKEYVVDAKVNYRGFINNRDEFIKYLETLNNIDPGEFENWTENQKLAYWINAYNAFTIKAIIDHYPIKRSFTLIGIFYAPKNSILQIPGVWKKLKFNVLGKEVTLDQIEHGILRKEFNEPRIHAAINCASISCPDLRDEAYAADRLDSQLSDASSVFVNTLRLLDTSTLRLFKYSTIPFRWMVKDKLHPG